MRSVFKCVTTGISMLALLQAYGSVTKPNVILFMADDMGMGDCGAYQEFTGIPDEKQIHTPSMERLGNMGVRFTDAHTPSSRCTPTRYGLLTGRDPWRTRLKNYVLFGSQGDPLIEADRPTLGTVFQSSGYGTAIVGKWHLGLLYSNQDGNAADDWEDADLSKPLLDGPLDHGFDFARYTSRSHGSSAPPQGKQKYGGPGHLHGRYSITANGPKTFFWEGPNAYVLEDLGARHSDNAIEYLSTHLAGGTNAAKPFFLYYPANSNHAPYTPVDSINGVPVSGAGKTKSGTGGDTRLDFVYENDVALGRLIDWLQANDDPRHPGSKLIDTTIVIFTSDNGAEKDNKEYTGPFRSNKASCYEGGHRVPFIVAWGAGGIGDGDESTPGMWNATPISLSDMYATFSELLNVPLPDLSTGAKGAEDSISALPYWRGMDSDRSEMPMFYNDHKESKEYREELRDPSVLSMRLDNPIVDGKPIYGQWKIFFTASLIRQGRIDPVELYDLKTDQKEETNRIEEPGLRPLIRHLSDVALKYRNSGGLRLAALEGQQQAVFDFVNAPVSGDSLMMDQGGLRMKLTVITGGTLTKDDQGLGVVGNNSTRVNNGEAIGITFDQDVIIHNVRIKAGSEGVCGGFFKIGNSAPLPVYCLDKHAEKYTKNDHSGMLADVGVLKAGQVMHIDSGSLYGSNEMGSWQLQSIQVCTMQ